MGGEGGGVGWPEQALSEFGLRQVPGKGGGTSWERRTFCSSLYCDLRRGRFSSCCRRISSVLRSTSLGLESWVCRRSMSWWKTWAMDGKGHPRARGVKVVCRMAAE
jgi:hypothetical protein